MELGLKDKKVLVTGSSRGIGAAIAEAFLSEDSFVCITSRGQKKLLETESRFKKDYESFKVLAKKCDCTKPKELSLLSRKIKDEWGGIDILVANVGDGQSTPDPIPSRDQWKKAWNTNFQSALETTRVFLPMLEESRGSLLFIASITGKEALGAPVDYSTAKTALIAFAKNISRKLGDKIRVNVIAPGNILFPGSSWANKLKENQQKVEETIKLNVPMNRFGKPEDIAYATLFLSSDKASFITGSLLVVDGGQTISLF